jgi:hypothetical protein
MNCLIDYIGLTGCGESSPASGLFINSLPGISLKSIEQLADAEQKTYVGVWEDVQLRATKRLQLAIIAALSKNYKVKSAQYSLNTFPITESSVTGAYSSPAFKFTSNCYSPLQYHHIESITVRKVSNANTITVTVYNADTNAVLYNNTFASTGETKQTVTLAEDFDATNIIVKVSVNGGSYYEDQWENIYFGNGDIKAGVYTGSTFTESRYGFGISFNYGLRCSIANLACHSKDLFALPLWYLLGSELMMERMVSERINKWTVDRKQAEELKAFYDNEAEKALSQALAGANINDSDCCIECDPPIAVREAYL